MRITRHAGRVDGGNGAQTRRGAELIVEYLVRERVPYVFGMCGHGDLGLLDALLDRTGEIRAISVHHESVAGFMADAYFRVRHEPVATFTSCGPGLGEPARRARARR